MERAINRRQQGDLGEASAIEWLMSVGAKRFDPEAIDFLFALVGDGRRWFIPSAAIEAETAVTLGGTKYSEFEIPPAAAIAPHVYGDHDPTLESHFGRGSIQAANGRRL